MVYSISGKKENEQKCYFIFKSGSVDPCQWLMDPDSDPDPDPDPAIFIIDRQDANKKQTWKKVFLLNTF